MDKITVVGVNHRTAPLEIREKLSFTESQIRESLHFLHNYLDECVIIFTCNRTEIFAVGDDVRQAQDAAVRLFGHFKKLKPAQIESALYAYSQEKAVDHLFRVAAGLDSMVLGETQILGQVKEAYGKACVEDTVGKVLHTLFQQAFKTGKRVHNETGINDNAGSVSYIAVKMAQERLNCLQGKSVLVLGAGEMSELTLKHLVEHGATSVLVANRTRERARELTSKFQGRVLDFKKLAAGLQECDIVIASTDAPHYVVHPETVQQVLEEDPAKELFFVDIALPRDVNPKVKDYPGIYLYDLDDLQEVANENIEERAEDARKAELILKEEGKDFMDWYHLSRVEPLIAALRQKSETIYRQETEEALSRLTNLAPKERKLVETMGRRIMNQLVKDPILFLKEMAASGQADEACWYVSRLFNLGEKAKGEEEESQKQNSSSTPGS